MSEMIREYGKTVVAVLAAMLVMVLLFGNLGFWEMLTRGAGVKTPIYTEYKDKMALKEVLEGAPPKIEYRNLQLMKGERVSVEELFFGLDGDGNFLEVKVLEVLSPIGSEVAVAEDMIDFENIGIYTCQVCTTDSQGRKTEKIFKIPVLRE